MATHWISELLGARVAPSITNDMKDHIDGFLATLSIRRAPTSTCSPVRLGGDSFNVCHQTGEPCLISGSAPPFLVALTLSQ